MVIKYGAAPKRFQSTWDTTQAGSANDTVVLPLVSDGSYNFRIDWGDGKANRDDITVYNQSEVTHQYDDTGVYTIKVVGDITGWYFNGAGDDDKILEISNWGPFTIIANDVGIFNGCSNLQLTATDPLVGNFGANGQNLFASCPNLGSGGYINNWDTSSLTHMYRMFYNNTTFNMDVSNWDVSNVTSIRETFNGCSNFNQDVGQWDVSNISRIRNCFNYCSNFDQDLSNWDVSIFGSGTDEGNGLFANCTSFNNGGSPGISGWSTTNWEGSAGMNSMFQNAQSFNQPIGTWDVSNVKSMTSMFENADSFNQDLSNWDVSSVTSMNSMFQSNAVFNNSGQTGIYNWDVSSCTNFAEMFDNADSFNQDIGGWTFATGLDKDITCFRMFRGNGGFNNGGSPSISGWNTSRVTNMQQMFDNANAFNQPIGDWDVSSVTSMSSMFSNADSFNQDIGSWNTSSVTDMRQMFSYNSGFNQPIGDWDVSNVATFYDMFLFATNFNNGGSSNISGWNVTGVNSVQDFYRMFYGASSFNQPIGAWDVSNVKSMQQMFYSASSFNNGGSTDISGWNTSNVTRMDNMFMSSAFNQPIGLWDVSNVTNMGNMFRNQFNQDISNWNVSNVGTMSQMFRSNTTFNQPIGSWNTISLTSINEMFNNADAFDQDLSNWVVTGVTSATNFMVNANGLSTTNYDRTLSGWSSQAVQNGVSINFGGSQYSTATGLAYRNALVASGWTITDGGAV